MNALPLVPARREGMSLSSCPLLSLVAFFFPDFQGLFSLSVSAILALFPGNARWLGASRWHKGPYFP